MKQIPVNGPILTVRRPQLGLPVQSYFLSQMAASLTRVDSTPCQKNAPPFLIFDRDAKYGLEVPQSIVL